MYKPGIYLYTSVGDVKLNLYDFTKDKTQEIKVKSTKDYSMYNSLQVFGRNEKHVAQYLILKTQSNIIFINCEGFNVIKIIRS
jgi:hypothetical protein